jgi:parallel beta-helix repeat protein
MLKKAGKLRRTASSIIVALFCLSLSVFAFTVQPARAEPETIYIRADGSISPTTANITTSDNVTYTFTRNNYEPIVVERNDITIDGTGYAVQGAGASLSIGMNLTGISNVTIKNVEIEAFYYGVYLYSSSNCTVSGNNITANKFIGGVYLDHSSGNTVSGNNITDNGYDGVYLYYSSNCTVSGNNITDNWKYGLYLEFSSNSTVSKNTFTNNGLYVWESFHNVVVDNSVNGKPLVYLEGVSGYAVTDAGQVVLVDCDSIVVNNLNLSHATVELWQTNSTRITNNNITNNYWDGVYLWYSSNCTVSGNNITNNAECGVDLEYSTNCTVSENNVTKCTYGILVESSFDTVSGNNITDNYFAGVGLYSSSNCTVSENTFTNDGLYVEDSFKNIVKDNSVNGKPLVYLEGVSGYAVIDAGQVVLVDCDSIVVNNLNLSYASFGVELRKTNNTRITNNNITDNSEKGVDLEYSSNCTVSGNNVANRGYGVVLCASSNCTVSGNNITTSIWAGVEVDYSSNSTVSGNNIADNGYGILLESSFDNRFFHNNFNGNTQQVVSYSSTNVWDDGYPSGGNFWSDYLTKYPNATEIDHTGIGNTTYVIDANNTDHYPLMNPYQPPILYSVTFTESGLPSGTSWNVTFNGTTSSSSSSTITFTGVNNGTYSYTVGSAAGYTASPSTGSVTVNGADVNQQITFTIIPEFTSPLILPLFAITTLLAAFAFKKKRSEKGVTSG